MGTIRALPRAVAEKIAAGEVVERPASVVKELVENAIDAGAGAIRVDVEGGGIVRISVTDDGCGMDADDLALSVQRHATSKISDEQDLERITTMGFRGEALATIGAVSQLAIETRVNRPEVIEGARIEVIGSEMTEPVVAGCAGGTRIDVRDLFFNVPARRKFLRSAGVELGHIVGVVQELSLASPGVRFELTADGRRRYQAGADSAQERALAVLGERFRGALVVIDEVSGDLGVRGWVAPNGRPGGKDVHLFLNGRPVRDRVLIHAVNAGFGEGHLGSDHPACVLWIDMDPKQVDVNVHPAKREVRFAQSAAVHDFVMRAVQKGVSRGATLLREGQSLTEPALNNAEGFAWTMGDGRKSVFVHRPSERSERTSIVLRNAQECVNETAQISFRENQSRAEAGLRPLGQFNQTYIVCEDVDGALVLIDQHAAHERLGFDALKKQYTQGRVAQQRLLVPERIELDAQSLAYIDDHGEMLARAGFEIEPFGGHSILVKAVPALLADANLQMLFARFALEVEQIGASRSIDDALEKIFALAACHGQVRAGDRLSIEEMTSLLRDMQREDVTHCPHGRPVIVRIETDQIEKWFRRIP